MSQTATAIRWIRIDNNTTIHVRWAQGRTGRTCQSFLRRHTQLLPVLTERHVCAEQMPGTSRPRRLTPSWNQFKGLGKARTDS
jgi:hypothetical protein